MTYNSLYHNLFSQVRMIGFVTWPPFLENMLLAICDTLDTLHVSGSVCQTTTPGA